MADKPTFFDWLGLRRLRDWDYSRAQWLGGLVSLLLALLALMIVLSIFGVVATLTLSVLGFIKPPEHFDMRGAGVLAAALLSAPFVIWRTWVAQNQARVSEDALYNDKVNAATTDLYARYQKTELHDGKAHDHWQDDVIRRNAAIDRLEALANERPQMAPRIARMLEVYLKELSREYPAEEPPETDDPGALRVWVDTLKVQRTDMEKAAQTLGQLRKIPGVDLKSLKFNLSGISLQGVDLRDCDFAEANLSLTKMQGSCLISTQMQNADLFSAQMQGAYLANSKMHGADLSAALLQGARLGMSKMGLATNLTMADFGAASAQWVDWRDVDISADQIKEIFGDASAVLPAAISRPPHWPAHVLDPARFDLELEKWSANPGAYTPPPQPKKL